MRLGRGTASNPALPICAHLRHSNGVRVASCFCQRCFIQIVWPIVYKLLIGWLVPISDWLLGTNPISDWLLGLNDLRANQNPPIRLYTNRTRSFASPPIHSIAPVERV